MSAASVRENWFSLSAIAAPILRDWVESVNRGLHQFLAILASRQWLWRFRQGVSGNRLREGDPAGEFKRGAHFCGGRHLACRSWRHPCRPVRSRPSTLRNLCHLWLKIRIQPRETNLRLQSVAFLLAPLRLSVFALNSYSENPCLISVQSVAKSSHLRPFWDVVSYK